MSKEVITQRRLAVLMAQREKLKTLELAVKVAEKELGAQERTVMAMLLADATVEPGKWSAGMETKQGNCTPKWKELYIGHMRAAHDEPEAAVEERARALYPAQSKTVLVVVAKTGEL